MDKTQNKKKNGFTLVELIIVITILAILATIAFISFQNYSGNARDGNRVATIKNIQNGLELLSVKTGNYPEPENIVEISGSGIFLKQGFFGKSLQQAIKISGDVIDPLDATEYVYSTNQNNTKYQLGTYLEENDLVSYFPQTYANEASYSKRHFYTLGHKIGILLEEDSSPILKEKYLNGIDLDENITHFKAYFSNDINSGSYVGNGEELIQKITEIQKQNSLPTSGNTENSTPSEPSEPVYDCNNVTDESAFAFENGEITGYNTTIGGLDVVIPCTINGETVTSIANYGLFNKGLTSVKIPNTVTSIGDGAFFVNQLTGVTIPNSVTTIGTSAFQQNQLVSLVLPNNITSIGDSVFNNNKLTSVVIPNSVITIGTLAFANNKLTNVIIPNNVTTIGTSVFANNLLESLTISNRITTLSNGAFNNNKLTSVVIPNNVTTIGTDVFRSNNLTTITILNTVTSIGTQAFQLNNLTSVTIPNSVMTIGTNVFRSNGPFKDSGNITDWTSGNGGTWNLSGATWIKQN
ncbi:MAG: leucine-rich repeat protein [Candidatus Altimarinota bacterium]